MNELTGVPAGLKRIFENRVPTGWTKSRLDKVAQVTYGISDPIDRTLLSGVKIISLPNVDKNGQFVLKEVPLIESDKVKSEHYLKSGDLLFNWRNGSKEHLGKTAYFNLKGRYTHVGFLLKIQTNSEKINPYFLHAYISFIRQKGFFLRAKIQVNNTFNKEELNELPVLFPPLPEQLKIAEILSTWDEAIDLTQQLINTKQRRKKGLMQQLLTGKVRFPEFVQSIAKQETKFVELPADWEYVTIGEVAKHISVKNKGGIDLTVLSCTKYDGLVDSLGYFGRQIYSEDTSTYKVVSRGQFAYATNHIEEGSIGYQDLYDEALISPMYTVFKTNGKINDSFFYSVLKTELYRHIFEVNTSSSVDRRGSLRWNEFSKIKIPVPSLPEQQRIVEVLSACDEEITLLQQKLTALQKQKKGLMQQLLTGKTRVTV